ncbi:MAG TPA: DUF2721 domain-containing protein [Chthoniobacteraceae bacterium]
MSAGDPIGGNPFAALTYIAAPAVLTNAASVLALSTSNRFLRAADRMRALFTELKDRSANRTPAETRMLVNHVDRVERQAVWLLSALRGAYLALGSFASASLISILGATLASSTGFHTWSYPLTALGLIVGFVGAGGLVWGCTHLFRATRLSMQNITEEAAMMRESNKSLPGL